jgi:signal transduction histidine kinase
LHYLALEALNNTLKHAAATEVTVRLSAHDRQVELEVSDNGLGFDPAAPEIAHGGMGLMNIKERVAKLGGSLAIISAPGAGTCIRVAIAPPSAGD